MKRLMRCILLLSVVATTARAQQAEPRPPEGRYVKDIQQCGHPYNFLTLRSDLLDTDHLSCTGLSYRLKHSGPGDRVVWDLTGKQCVLEEGGIHTFDFEIEALGASVKIKWPGESTSETFYRCGK
jgi:hypothetical protein